MAPVGRRFHRDAADDEPCDAMAREAFILLHSCGLGTAGISTIETSGMQFGHDGPHAHKLPPSAPVRAAGRDTRSVVPRSRCDSYT